MTESYDSYLDTKDHIHRVTQLLEMVVRAIRVRQSNHDQSKLASPEKESFDRETPLLRSLTYNSPEYHESKDRLGEALAHHYKHNTHHPEHFGTAGVNGMDLLDVIEMLMDWKAAGERHADGSMSKSLESNRERFGISEQLDQILWNTANHLGFLDDDMAPEGETA